ncbi:MAG: hypothetical protein KAS32_02310 [Candidatus Peribacteraceae bacterium]|nr:hypothetical protein [Candidatus Peribacteraceae bacterium]
MSEISEAWAEHIKNNAITKKCIECYALDKNYLCIITKEQKNIASIEKSIECESYYPTELTFASYYRRKLQCPRKVSTFTRLEKFLIVILTLISLYLIIEGASSI